MTDIIIKTDRHCGYITLNRPQALNALTWDMCLAIEKALDSWRHDPGIKLVICDAAGDRAFCSGGDIAEMYATGRAGKWDYGRRFWQDEYRLNAKIAEYPKPVVTFMQGFTMGGGVGIGCHASHRIVGETSRIAMPECSIGLVPDVGGSFLLARSPGFCGTYLGLTGDRMDAADALYAGFADHFIPHDVWDALKDDLCATGKTEPLQAARTASPASRLQDWQGDIDMIFRHDTLHGIYTELDRNTGPIATTARKMLDRNAPLAMAVAVQNIAALRADPHIRTALTLEYRYTYRSAQQGDFIEGIRAAIIDRDRAPRWQHATYHDLPASEIARMIAPLGDQDLIWEDQP